MSDIFISYAREDRDKAQALAAVLEAQGWSVWWDRSIPAGRSFDQVIEEALNAAKCVIALWSRPSVGSDWVKTEAAEGLVRKVLVPVRIEETNLPLEFRRLQTVDLSGWKGDSADPELRQLLQAVASLLKSEVRLTTPEVRRRSWLKPGVVVGAIVGVLVIGWLVFHFATRAQKPAIAEQSTPAGAAASSATAAPAEAVPDLMRTSQLALEFWQHDKLRPMFIVDESASKTRVVLEPGPFEIRCPHFKAAVQICAWLDDSIFADINSDRKIEDVLYFSPGTGMADSEFGTPRLRIENRAHNYFAESRRRQISEQQDSIYISSLTQEGNPLKDWPPVYLVVFVNRDQNDEIAADEFERIVLEFAR